MLCYHRASPTHPDPPALGSPSPHHTAMPGEYTGQTHSGTGRLNKMLSGLQCQLSYLCLSLAAAFIQWKTRGCIAICIHSLGCQCLSHLDHSCSHLFHHHNHPLHHKPKTEEHTNHYHMLSVLYYTPYLLHMPGICLASRLAVPPATTVSASSLLSADISYTAHLSLPSLSMISLQLSPNCQVF